MFKRRNRVWVAVLLAGALVAGLATQAFATPVAPDRPTGLTADLDSGGGVPVLLSSLFRRLGVGVGVVLVGRGFGF